MSKVNNFEVDLGYTLPDTAPSSANIEERAFYQHAAGNYVGFIGRLNAKYKDANGKRCNADTPGATFSHYMLPIWLTQFLGTPDAPTKEDILKLVDDNILIPNRATRELYFNIYIPNDPKRLWTLKIMFGKWQFPEHPQYNIIVPNPSNPAANMVNFKGFPAYYGLPVNFNITFKADSEKKTRYIDSHIIVIDYTARLKKEILEKFENDINLKVKAEMDARNNNNSNEYAPPPPPEPNFDSMADVEDGLDEFLGDG